jgi:hypothetical protein
MSPLISDMVLEPGVAVYQYIPPVLAFEAEHVFTQLPKLGTILC